MFMCHQSSMSYGRVWKEKGVMGYCLCPAEKDEFNSEWAALRSGREVTMACGEGYSGELTRQGSFFGDWVKVSGECVRNRCPAEEQSTVMWAATGSMEMASCVSGLGAGFACVSRGVVRGCDVGGDGGLCGGVVLGEVPELPDGGERARDPLPLCGGLRG